jgi:hypothetical protein
MTETQRIARLRILYARERHLAKQLKDVRELIMQYEAVTLDNSDD